MIKRVVATLTLTTSVMGLCTWVTSRVLEGGGPWWHVIGLGILALGFALSIERLTHRRP